MFIGNLICILTIVVLVLIGIAIFGLGVFIAGWAYGTNEVLGGVVTSLLIAVGFAAVITFFGFDSGIRINPNGTLQNINTHKTFSIDAQPTR